MPLKVSFRNQQPGMLRPSRVAAPNAQNVYKQMAFHEDRPGGLRAKAKYPTPPSMQAYAHHSAPQAGRDHRECQSWKQELLYKSDTIFVFMFSLLSQTVMIDFANCGW